MEFEAWARMGVLLVRPGALIMATPLFGTPFAPAPVRLGLTILLGLTAAPFVPVPESATTGALSWVILREMAIGMSLGLAVRLLVAVAEGAGHLAGHSVGLSYGAMLDPQSGVRNSTLAIIYANLTLVLCLLLGVHHELIRGLIASYRALPIGLGAVGATVPDGVAHVLGFVFTGALRLAAPVIFVTRLAPGALELAASVARAFR